MTWRGIPGVDGWARGEFEVRFNEGLYMVTRGGEPLVRRDGYGGYTRRYWHSAKAARGVVDEIIAAESKGMKGAPAWD